MKRTELERKERELRRTQKKSEVLQRKQNKQGNYNVGVAIQDLVNLLYHDGEKIYNTEKDDKLVEFFMEIKESCKEKDWDPILRKAIRKIGITQKEEAYGVLRSILDEC